MYVDAGDRCRHPFVVASTIAKYNGKVHSGTVLLPQSRVLRAYFPEMKSILSPAQRKIVRGHMYPDGVGRVALWFSLHLANEGSLATSRSEDHHFKFLRLHGVCVFFSGGCKNKKKTKNAYFFFFRGKIYFFCTHLFPMVRIIAKKPKANKTDIKIPIPRPLEFRSVVVFFSASFVLFIFFSEQEKKTDVQ